mmetsp:Transcript_31994/g.47786  ORF Transcript_31994/g.47786 Transcript_31994/m.47786 type:complete len:328 (+) Transcript_31994:2186-3169(+)
MILTARVPEVMMTIVMMMTRIKAALTMVLWCQVSLHNILNSSSSITRLKLDHKIINNYSTTVVITMTHATSITNINTTRASTNKISMIQRQRFRTILQILLQHLTQVYHTRMSLSIEKATKFNMRSTHQSNLMIQTQNFQQKIAMATWSLAGFHRNFHQAQDQDPIPETIETPLVGERKQSLNTPQLNTTLTKCVRGRLHLMLMIANLLYHPGPTRALILQVHLTRIRLLTGFQLLLRGRREIEEGQCHRRHQENFLLLSSSDMFLRRNKGAYLHSSNDMFLLKSRGAYLPPQGVLVLLIHPRTKWNIGDKSNVILLSIPSYLICIF